MPPRQIEDNQGNVIEDAAIDMSSMVIDPEDFDESSFDDCKLKILDYITEHGKEIENKPGEFFNDQIRLLCEVQDHDDGDAPVIPWWLPLPKLDKSGGRKAPHVTSNLAQVLKELHAHGVSQNPDSAVVYHLARFPDDLIGLTLHRKLVEKQFGRSKRQVYIPIQILDMDHDLRENHERTLREIEFTPPV